MTPSFTRCSATITEINREKEPMNADVSTDRFARVIAAIDSANASDPDMIEIGDEDRPAELVYGKRMTEALATFCPDASEELRIAARGQHIRRWTSRRTDYPAGRTGYLKWRSDLKRFHADTLARIMNECGYGEAETARVRSLVTKQRLKHDPDSQTLEDVVCLVFLEHYFEDFAAKHADDKVIDIVRKTWRKMSPRGHEAALALDLSAESGRLVSAAVADAA